MTDDSEAVRDRLLHDELDRGEGDPLRGSRTSGFWAATVGLGVVLLLLIIFIAQNTRQTTVSFLAWDGRVPVAVALMIAAVAGLFLALLAGLLRILQLRRRVRRTQS
ncbi:MAG TPA: lipopolysaccharide assembly protein LapA domain-containing protein [Nocardioides sp.]|nr:lipopolysaccharide assembly protein LapA domain-containing protein [Nocardioides sp.]